MNIIFHDFPHPGIGLSVVPDPQTRLKVLGNEENLERAYFIDSYDELPYL